MVLTEQPLLKDFTPKNHRKMSLLLLTTNGVFSFLRRPSGSFFPHEYQSTHLSPPPPSRPTVTSRGPRLSPLQWAPVSPAATAASARHGPLRRGPKRAGRDESRGDWRRPFQPGKPGRLEGLRPEATKKVPIYFIPKKRHSKISRHDLLKHIEK